MNTTTRKLTHSALMIAMATALSVFAVMKMPNGGSVTFASAVPIIVIALMYDTRWALMTSVTYSLIQMLLGFYAPPTQDLISFLMVILLDYVIAFGAIGCAGMIARRFKGKMTGAAVATVCVLLIRLSCSFLSGVLIWSAYAPEGMPVWLFSLTYNSSYMIPEMIINAVVAVLLVKYVDLNKLAAKTPISA